MVKHQKILKECRSFSPGLRLASAIIDPEAKNQLWWTLWEQHLILYHLTVENFHEACNTDIAIWEGEGDNFIGEDKLKKLIQTMVQSGSYCHDIILDFHNKIDVDESSR